MKSKLRALIFDVDGTLADNERDGHRVAFNLAFRDAGLDWDWDVETYDRLLEVFGGKERIKYYIESFRRDFEAPADLDAFIRKLHREKTAHYLALLKSGAIPLRPGVARLLREARAAGLRLAIASTTTFENATTLLSETLGEESVAWFDVIAAGDVVENKKPAPDIYEFALDRLGLEASECLVFEDTEAGLASATAAGLATLITVNGATRDQDFSGAAIVLDQLGEPERGFEVLAGDAGEAAFVDVAFLRRVHSEVPGRDRGPSASQRHYGNLADGMAVSLVRLRNANGIEADVISYGGIITRIMTPDASGQLGDIVLGLDALDEYVACSPYFGALIGRYGNRIANAEFKLDGVSYRLDANDGNNHLHGGFEGFDKKNWSMTPFVTETSAGVLLTLISPDGDQGYPGELDLQVTCELTNENELDMRFSATTDKPTVVNMTQHSYFNLAGEGDVLDHQLMIAADYITPVKAGLIPTGEFLTVEGGPFDFRQAKPIGQDIQAGNEQLELGHGYDHNFVLKELANDELVLAARVTEPVSGRVLEVLTAEPGLQFYSGNFLDGSSQGKGRVHSYRGAFCLEPQHFPDSPNQADFPSTTLLPGDTYQSRIVYRFSTIGQE